MMLVLSSLPPRPTSTTATSTFSSANQRKAIPVVISKKESPRASMSASRSHRKDQTYSLGTSSTDGFRPAAPAGPSSAGGQAMRILSLKSTMWGEVYSPTFSPAAARADASMLATDPLPFVPATWMEWKESWGSPRILANSRMPSSPGLYASPKGAACTEGCLEKIFSSFFL